MELIMGSIWANSGVNNGGNDGAHNEFMTSSWWEIMGPMVNDGEWIGNNQVLMALRLEIAILDPLRSIALLAGRYFCWNRNSLKDEKLPV